MKRYTKEYSDMIGYEHGEWIKAEDVEELELACKNLHRHPREEGGLRPGHIVVDEEAYNRIKSLVKEAE